MESKADKEILEFALKEIDSLEKENRMLKMKNKNTIKLTVYFNDRIYEIDTQLEKKLKEDNFYYLANNNIDPAKVKLINYEVSPSLRGTWIIYCNCLNMNNNEFEYYNETSLFKSKDKASDYYLKTKYGGRLNESR